ncbi:response regulator [Thermocoleostomius sinensis]|uniref:Response regulator n=1 Tax=Thermocoleostomius sinensis A174 TaxID=2016057 RepID=A0A9E8ZHB0_9CYAN|nr:response regulator [Thermocoleostomius sinensis]WAL62751.1 response regulator [Thermocoleostomius sinensis A174]
MQHLDELTDELTVKDPAPLKILLAEDNLTNQKLAIRQLQFLGYEADVVTDGKAAIAAATQSHYDLILMDCQMPILNGFEATAAIRNWERQLSRSVQIIVVAMTASDLHQDRERAIAAGMDDFLIKPVHKEILAALLTHWQQRLAMNQRAAQPMRRILGHPPTSVLQRLPVLLDLEHLHRLSDDKPEFELELLQIFLQDSRRQLEILKQAVYRQNTPQIYQSVHHIRGASANVGARAMQFVAERLEAYVQQSMPVLNFSPTDRSLDTISLKIAMMQELTAKLDFSLAQIQLAVDQMRVLDQSQPSGHCSLDL